MNTVDVIRAWKDRSYRNSLSQEQLAALPANPVGTISDVEAELVAGGRGCFRITGKTGGVGAGDQCETE